MRVTSKGQVTIPKPVRDHIGIGAGSEVDFVIEDDRVVLRRAVRPQSRSSRGGRLVEAIRGTSTANRDLSTDQIMQMLRGDD